ncbi:MAG TPA: NAD(P)H-hydrate dehydratase [Chitinophagaceae bacterium]|nr:NAD(P)H-hydrate dehydratase [Chitinophagaceae bacterium]
MLILTAKQIHDWDTYTIQHTPISSLNLMETAATRCVQWLAQHQLLQQPIHIFCGKGNNGGDGLAIARLLSGKGIKVWVYIIELGQIGTPDFQSNLARLHETAVTIQYIQSPDHFPAVPAGHLIIDALFGTGLNRALNNLPAALVQYINECGNTVIAIDVPSGLLADESSKGATIIKALHTLSFQCLKMAFVMAENEIYTGEVHILDIGLLEKFLTGIHYPAMLVEPSIIKAMYRPRARFSHKGTFGHAALIAGSHGFMGAATLSAQACVRAGAGKLTCYVPATGYTIMQLAVPEAMCSTTGERMLEELPAPEKLQQYQAIGIGPGIGAHESHASLLAYLFEHYKKPMVIDADALNVLSKHQNLLPSITAFSLLTPHPAEFDRLFGASANDFARMRKAREKAQELQLIIVLKGHRTLIAMPGGNCFFNSTGNPGMATGGSGDVLTGILTSLLAQQYPPEQAALLGVYLHGLAGDLAAADLSEEAMIAGDITAHLAKGFQKLKE